MHLLDSLVLHIFRWWLLLRYTQLWTWCTHTTLLRFTQLLHFIYLGLVLQNCTTVLHQAGDELLLHLDCEWIDLNSDVLEQIDILHLRILHDDSVQEIFALLDVVLVPQRRQDDRVVHKELWIVIHVDILDTYLGRLWFLSNHLNHLDILDR